MAIQTINLTVPGGDTPRSANTKINANFSDQSNAASRLVGTATGNVMQVGAFGIGENGGGYPNFSRFVAAGADDAAGTPGFQAAITVGWDGGLRLNQILTGLDGTDIGYRKRNENGIWGTYFKIYHTGNTTKEPTTGYLKAASPILHLFNDDLTKEHEAVEQDITVEKLGTGDYLIKGSTGLSSEGWSLSPPKDIHGNVLCMVEATEVDGNINVKTYKRKFDFDIVAIVPDYDQPFDIPDGHSVDLRLNDLPAQTNNP